MSSSRLLRGRRKETEHSSKELSDPPLANPKTELDLLRSKFDFLFWAWRQFLVLVVATALAVYFLLSMIEGRLSDSELLRWLEQLLGASPK